MGFKEVADLSPDTTIALGGVNKKTGKANPTKVEGYYLGKRTVEDRKKKSGVSYIYVLQTPKGNVGVWGKTDLDRKMQEATPGHMIRITQNGTVATPNGDMYKFKVEFDDTNTIDVLPAGGGNTGLSGGDVEADDYSADDDEDGNTYGSDAATEAPAYASAGSAAERKAKVEALLKGKNRKG